MPRWYNKDSRTGNMIPLGVKVEDTLPVGTEVDYDGQDIPEGWEEVNNVLWENSDDTETFANQTISMDLSNYNKFVIVFKGRKTENFYCTDIIYVKGITHYLRFPSFFNFLRGCTITDTGINFSNGFYYATLGNTATTITNDYIIPYKILGYK